MKYDAEYVLVTAEADAEGCVVYWSVSSEDGEIFEQEGVILSDKDRSESYTWRMPADIAARYVREVLKFVTTREYVEGED